MSDSIEELMRRRDRLAGVKEPAEVVVVSPKVDAAELVGRFVSGAALLSARAGVVSLAAGHVEAIPDFGYVESAWLVLFAHWLLPTVTGSSWTRSWNQRARAEYDRASAALRRALKRGVDAAAKASERP